MNKKAIFLITTLSVSWLCVVVMAGAILKQRKQVNEAAERNEQKLQEIINSEDVITYVEEEPYNFYTEERTKETISSVLQTSIPDAGVVNVIATLFDMYGSAIEYPWMINYNKGYCDTFQLYFDGSERILTVDCYCDGIYVLTDNGTRQVVYVHGTVLQEFNRVSVESLRDLLNRSDEWLWNVSECCAVLGIMQERFPDVSYDYQDGDLVLSTGDIIAMGDATMQLPSSGDTATLISLYSNIQSVPIVIPADPEHVNVFPADTYNIVTFVDLAEEQELVITEEQLVLVFSKDEPANMLESWSYDIDGANFNVCTVGTINGKTISYELFTIDMETGDVSIYY